MARYFFDLKTPELISDREGDELPTVASAVDEAALAAEELVRDAELAEENRDDWVIVVREHTGVLLLELPLREWVAMGAVLQ